MQEERGGRPSVFALNATGQEIIALHPGRSALTITEREVLLEPARLDRLTDRITVAGTSTTVADLKPDSQAPAEAVARWRKGAARYDKLRYSQ